MVAKAIGPAVAAVSLSLLLAVGAGAKPVLQEGFGAQPKGMRGGEIVGAGQDRGWRGPGGDRDRGRDFVEYDMAGLRVSPEKGTIEFSITRDEVFHREAAFSLVDKSGDRLFALRFYWDFFPDGPALTTFTSNISETTQPAFWYIDDPKNPGSLVFHIPIGRSVAKGQKIHIALTWNGAAGAIYIDGKSLNVKTDPKAPFSALMAAAERLIIGAEFDNRVPQGAWSVSHSVISNFQVHSEALSAAELGVPIPVPVVAAVEHDAGRVAGFSGKLIAGNTVNVTMHGSPAQAGSFDIVHYPEIGGRVNLDWRGWGVYLEDKVFFEAGEVNLRDVEGYRVYASTAPFDPAAPGMEPIAELEAGVQNYDFEFLEVDTPYYLAAVARMRDGTTRTVVAPIAKRPMTETAPGIYAGSYQAGWQDRYPRAVVVGRLEHGGVAATLVNTNTLAIDSGLTIAVAAEPNELKADETSKAKVSVTVTDANGNPVSGHKLKFVLATTSQYTGVVGGGDFADQVGGKISENRFLETDLFGKAEVTYVAGFAAKTAIIVARDMLSNSIGTGWVKTYITATAQLELEPVNASVAMAQGYVITVMSSDEWLTADGKSQARITARVTLGGEPVEGHNVGFSVSPGAGSIRSVVETTNRNGEARAVYTAGKKIGIALITATDTTAGISGTVSIELRSDAPAKIVIKLDPVKLPADGKSRADLSVLVTDINDNPNDNTEVEYAISGGGGKLRYDKGLTDRKGENANEYTAGRSAGMVTFDITVRSTTPSEEELTKAGDLAVAVTDFKFF